MDQVHVNFNQVSQVNLYLITKDQPVDALLNKITDQMLADDAFDQRHVFAENRHFYHIILRDGTEGAHQSFYLKDFLFDHNSLDQAGNQDSFMRMLDRDRLGEAMRATLIHQFGLIDTAHAPYEDAHIPCFWRRTMRNISHPAYLAFEEKSRKTAPVPIAA